jgi:microcin C transport system substrate-binding protein
MDPLTDSRPHRRRAGDSGMGHVLRVFCLGLALGLIVALPAWAESGATVSHGASLHGGLKYGPDFTHFDYVNPDAPKGGTVRQSAIGTFDSLNPFILKGQSAAGIGLIYESLMTPSLDEPDADYGLIAESIEVPDDISWVVFNLRPEARWHDGRPITADDVVYSFDILKTKGHPFYRAYYAAVARAEKLGTHKVKFVFREGLNRELPKILGQLTVLPQAYYETHEFDRTTLEPPLGSGPYRIVDLEAGRSITYERIADHWGRDLPVNRGSNNFDVIRIDYYRDSTIALEAFKAHEYDFRFENTAKVWATGYDFPATRQGLVLAEEIPHENPTGMQAFVFNTRRAIFEDRRVRRALAYAFDFEWTNANLFNGAYTRTASYFSNSELAAQGLPSAEELALLEPFRGHIPDEVFTDIYAPPKTDGSGNVRANLRSAKKLLEEAGWIIEAGRLVHAGSREPMEIEFLLVQPAFERIIGPLAQNLKRLGIESRIRTVDTAQYQNRLDQFDFNIVSSSFPQSLSPGNEQLDFWGSSKAYIDGSRNLIGIVDPAVDALIEAIIAAPDRAALVTATQALDRVLLWSHYVIPQWHIRTFRVAYWNRFGQPRVRPQFGLGFNTWWIDPDRDAALQRGEAALVE